jgi:hypothetical protein
LDLVLWHLPGVLQLRQMHMTIPAIANIVPGTASIIAASCNASSVDIPPALLRRVALILILLSFVSMMDPIDADGDQYSMSIAWIDFSRYGLDAAILEWIPPNRGLGAERLQLRPHQAVIVCSPKKTCEPSMELYVPGAGDSRFSCSELVAEVG